MDPKSILKAALSASAIIGGELVVLIHNFNDLDSATTALSLSQFPFDTETVPKMFKPSI
jgi:hypothetical protein